LKAAKKAMRCAPEIVLPTLVLQAEEDKMVNPEKTKEFFDSLKSADKTWRLYEGLYHGLLIEKENEMVFRDIETWLEKRLPS
jgi:alpha-beta hydrolase superfamily lysophospholipase